MTDKKKTNPIDIYLGSRVRHYRRLSSMTEKEFAKKLDVTFQQVRKYERGNIRMSPSIIVKMCNVLPCHILDLFEQYMGNKDKLIKGPGRQRILNVIKYYKKMNSEKRPTLMKIAKHFSKGS